MEIPLIYELPLFVFIVLAIYTIHSLLVARKFLFGGEISTPYFWFIVATGFFALWGVDHIYHDLVPLSEEVAMFFHYVVSHGFLLVSMSCVAFAAHKTKQIYKSAAEGDKK